MRRLSTYRLRQIGHMLKAGTAWIEGKTTDGDRWPEGNHYWIITDSINQATYHVKVIDRPSWGRYEN